MQPYRRSSPANRFILRPALGVLAALSVVAALALWSLHVAAAPAPATAAEPRVLALRYGVFLGDIYALGFDVTLDLDRGGYTASADGGTRGTLAQMFAWRGSLTSRGKLAALAPTPAGLVPARFDSVSEWQGKPQRMTLLFKTRGRYAVEHHPAEPRPRAADARALPKTLPAGAMDPVAAAVQALSASARDSACERRIPVFDGRRRYDLLIHDVDGEKFLRPSKVSAYSGPVLSCRIAIKRISGFGKRDAVDYFDEDSPNPPIVAAAGLAPGMPLVPVRLAATINLGTVVAHLVHAELRENGTTRVLAELKR